MQFNGIDRAFPDVIASCAAAPRPGQEGSWISPPVFAAYLALQRTSEAQRCLERALELNPEYTIAKHNLLLIQAGR